MNNGLTYPALGFFSFQYVYSSGQFVLPNINCQGFNVTKTGTSGKIWSGNGTSAPNTQLPANATGPLPADQSNDSSPSNSNSLGTGAIAGLVVGVAAALLLIFAALLFFLRRKWKRNSIHPNGSGGPLWMYQNIQNQQGQEKAVQLSPFESGGATLRGELGDDQVIHNELPAEPELRQ